MTGMTATVSAPTTPARSPGACWAGGAAADPRLKSMATVLADTTAKIKEGRSAGARVWPTGFDAARHLAGGGVRSGSWFSSAGRRLGKTTMALQMLRRSRLDRHR